MKIFAVKFIYPYKPRRSESSYLEKIAGFFFPQPSNLFFNKSLSISNEDLIASFLQGEGIQFGTKGRLLELTEASQSSDPLSLLCVPIYFEVEVTQPDKEKWEVRHLCSAQFKINDKPYNMPLNMSLSKNVKKIMVTPKNYKGDMKKEFVCLHSLIIFLLASEKGETPFPIDIAKLICKYATQSFNSATEPPSSQLAIK